MPLILCPNVDRSHSIPMVAKATFAAPKATTLHWALAPMPAARTRFARVALLLQHHLHAVPLSLVGEHVAYAAM